MADAPYLRLTSIVKDFGSFRALRGVSLDIAKGEFVCFLGPSGCGKTTLLRVVAGLDPQNEGRVEIAGRDVTRLPPSARDYGIVFQSYALFPNLTVEANIAYGLKGPREAKRARVNELLDLIGLPGIGAKFPSQLSGGQQQRVALARALAPSPGLLLLDEPLSALDARVRLGLRRRIREIHDRLGITTIMVTHDQEEALTTADRIVVMNQGEIAQVGTPEEIYRDPRGSFVADFVGTMNFLPGTVCEPGRVRLGSLELDCEAARETGREVLICVRPEDVTIHRNGAPNTLSMSIRSMEFLGPVHRARLWAEALGDRPIIADFSAGVVRDHGLRPGDAVPVTLPSERLRLYPAS